MPAMTTMTLLALCSVLVLILGGAHGRFLPDPHHQLSSNQLSPIHHQSKRSVEADPSQMWSFSPYDFYTRLILEGDSNADMPASTAMLNDSKKRSREEMASDGELPAQISLLF